MNLSTIRRLVCSVLLMLTAPLPAVAQQDFTNADADAVQAFLRRTFTNGHAGMVIGILDQHSSRVLQGMPLSWENITYFVREIVGIGMALDAEKTTGLMRRLLSHGRSGGTAC